MTDRKIGTWICLITLTTVAAYLIASPVLMPVEALGGPTLSLLDGRFLITGYQQSATEYYIAVTAGHSSVYPDLYLAFLGIDLYSSQLDELWLQKPYKTTVAGWDAAQQDAVGVIYLNETNKIGGQWVIEPTLNMRYILRHWGDMLTRLGHDSATHPDPDTTHVFRLSFRTPVELERIKVGVDALPPNASIHSWVDTGILIFEEPTPTPTNTATATATFTATPTATPTATFTPTYTPTQTPTATSTPTATFTPTFTPSHTPTATATATSTSSATPTATETSTATLTPTATATHTATRPPTDTHTPTPTASATSTATATRPSTLETVLPDDFCVPWMQATLGAAYYFDPGVVFVTTVRNMDAECDFDGPPEDRTMIVRGYADRGNGPIQWQQVEIVVPEVPAGGVVGGNWNAPDSAWGQRILKWDMHALMYVFWVEWNGTQISPTYMVGDPDYVP